MKLADCELCKSDGGTIVLANEWLRVTLVDEPNYPGYVRVIWNEHVREMTELSDDERLRLMRTVFAVEDAQIEVLDAAENEHRQLRKHDAASALACHCPLRATIYITRSRCGVRRSAPPMIRRCRRGARWSIGCAK